MWFGDLLRTRKKSVSMSKSEVLAIKFAVCQGALNASRVPGQACGKNAQNNTPQLGNVTLRVSCQNHRNVEYGSLCDLNLLTCSCSGLLQWL